MQNRNEMKTGTSLCFFGRVGEDVFRAIHDAGIRCFEYGGAYNYYTNGIDYPANAMRFAELAAKCGVEQWSFHLPFSRFLDISQTKQESRAVALYTNKTMIRAAGKAGVRVAVLHPSSEPIADEERPERMRLSREAIEILQEECVRAGMRLAVENLPRTCLCRTSDEMVELLSGTGAGVVFDTNHCLEEDNIHYVETVAAAGLEIVSMHVSDYFRDENGVLDERHVLPGEGINNWNALLDTVLRTGYRGPLMYEVPAKPKCRETAYSIDALAENMRRLKAGSL